MSLVLVKQIGPVLVITLNRPERHNSLVPELLEGVLEALESTKNMPDLNCVVLNAKGPSFSTGGDIGEFIAQGDGIADYSQHLVGLLNQVILALVSMPLPVIVAAQGWVTGGSIGLILAADIVWVTPNTRFAPYYCKVGFAPDGGWSAMLPQFIGKKRAAEIQFRNSTVTAQQALDWGLVNHIVTEEELMNEVFSAANQIDKMYASSISITKHLLNEDLGKLADRLEAERQLFVQQVTSEAAQQGIKNYITCKALEDPIHQHV